MGLLDLFGLGRKSENIQEYMTRGAVIIDVRTSGEFREGHIKNSKNIALDLSLIHISEPTRPY